MQKLGLPDNIIILDAEYTTWAGAMARNWSGPGEAREVIQIGAVRVQSGQLFESGIFSYYVRPTINPILSEYCKTVLPITQENVDKGLEYADALARFAMWSGNLPFYSWGHDLKAMHKNAERVGIHFPIAVDRSRDIREVFRDHGIDTSLYMSSSVPRAFGEEPPGKPHDALNDSRSILQALRALRRSIA